LDVARRATYAWERVRELAGEIMQNWPTATRRSLNASTRNLTRRFCRARTNLQVRIAELEKRIANLEGDGGNVRRLRAGSH
jgi:hypothetical protein